MLSHGLWQRRFGGDRSVVGRAVLLDAEPYEIVGVAPAGFDFPMGSEIWAPLSFDAKSAAVRNRRFLSVVGRLRPGRSLDDAKAQMAVIASRLEQQYPEANRDHGARVSTLVQGMRDQGIGPIMSLCQASAAFVLLIACANIANLLLARGAERQRELAVRSALGAGRGRLVRELLIEGAVLAAAAIPAALAVAWLGIRLMRVSMPSRIIRFVPGWERMNVDGRLVIFTGVLAAGAVLIFGVLPALRASRPHLTDALKDGGRAQTAGRSRQGLRRALVVAEMALSLPLLVAAGLGVIGTNRFLNGPQGYDPDGVLTMKVVLPDARYADPKIRRRFTDDVVERLSRLPGVQLASAANIIPSISSNGSRSIEAEGGPAPDPAHPPSIDYRVMTPDYFATLHIPLVRGRGFTTADREETAPVAIVSGSLVERYFPGSDGLGKRLKLGDSGWITIVGVARDVIHDCTTIAAIPPPTGPTRRRPPAAWSSSCARRRSSPP